MATRTAYPATESSGDTLTTTNFDKLPGGWLGYVEVTSDQGSITTSSTDLTSLTFTVTVNTSRRIKLSGQVRWQTDNANDDAGLKIMEGATVLNEQEVPLQRTTEPYGNSCFTVETPSGGSHTYKLQGGRFAGAGTLTMKASSTRKAMFLCEDIGPAS